MRKPVAILLALVAVAAGRAMQTAPTAQGKSVRFGDVVLRDFARAEFQLGVMAKVTGPSTVVDVLDSERKTTAQVRAREIVAHLTKPQDARSPRRDVGRVERIEASGGVVFKGSKKDESDGSTIQVQATGTKAVYDRASNKLTLEGPVSFSAEQPDASGNGKDTVTGKAQRAVYDEGKRTLQLFGDVQATVVTPDTPPEGSTFSGDEVLIDMSAQPYRVAISNPSLTGAITIKVREPGKPESTGEPKK